MGIIDEYVCRDSANDDQSDESKEPWTTTADHSPPPEASSSVSSTDDEYAPRAKVEERFMGASDKIASIPDGHGDGVTTDLDDLSQSIAKDLFGEASGSPQPTKIGKAKEKRARKAAQNSSAESKASDVRTPTCNRLTIAKCSPSLNAQLAIQCFPPKPSFSTMSNLLATLSRCPSEQKVAKEKGDRPGIHDFCLVLVFAA